ncbi:MAG: hypothetical protein IJ462_01075 [Clostridia bacterium]|nr:hypothetical protein [Clostridia bacterium]
MQKKKKILIITLCVCLILVAFLLSYLHYLSPKDFSSVVDIDDINKIVVVNGNTGETLDFDIKQNTPEFYTVLTQEKYIYGKSLSEVNDGFQYKVCLQDTSGIATYLLIQNDDGVIVDKTFYEFENDEIEIIRLIEEQFSNASVD